MKKKMWILLGMLVSIQPVYSMDLIDALSSAYKTNQDIQTSQQKFLIESEAFTKAVGDFLPSVNMEVDVTNQKQTSISQYVKNGSITNNGPDVSRSLVVTQNIFKGGQSTLGLKIAQARFKQSKAAMYSAEQKALTEALSAYLGLCVAKTKYDIATDTVTSYQQSLDTAKEKLKVGEATMTEVSAAQASFSEAQAGKSKNYANLITARAKFKNIIGVDPDDDMNFPVVPSDLPSSFEEFTAIVRKSNFDLMAVSSDLSQKKDTVKSTIGVLLPTADLSVQAGRNYLDPEIVNTSRTNGSSVTTKLAVKIPIFNNGTHSNVRQAKAQSRIAAYALDSVQNDVTAGSISAWEQFVAYKDSVLFADEAIQAQTIAFEGVKSEYSVGTKTMLDVLQQQDKLNTALSNAVDIKNGYIVAAYNIKGLMGKMTAKSLKLKARYFNPEAEFRDLKHKVVGF
jgi:outer membrane protein